MKTRWLFVCSCIALITSAFTFVIRGDILQALGGDFGLTQEQIGGIAGAAFLGMAFSMLVGGPVCDSVGMKKVMWLAFATHILGILGTIFAPSGEMAFRILFWASFLQGCGNGLVEVAINPLAATLYPDKKTHILNVLHAWWPGGLMMGGILARLVGDGLDMSFFNVSGLGLSWQFSMGLILVPCLAYGAMLGGLKFPPSERVAKGVSTVDMFKEAFRPMFIIWAFCMLLTAATELGPQQWQNSVITSTTDGKVSGTLILVYTSSMMFVLRHFAGPIANFLSPVGMLTCSATLSAIGLYLLSTATTAGQAFGYATIFGLGIAYFWPTMLGVTAERFPKGGAFLMALIGCAGNASIAYVLPSMGKIADHYSAQEIRAGDDALAAKVLNDNGVLKPDAKAGLAEDSEELAAVKAAESVGFSMAFRWVSVLPVLLIVIFGGIVIRDKAAGGYRPEELAAAKSEGA